MTIAEVVGGHVGDVSGGDGHAMGEGRDGNPDIEGGADEARPVGCPFNRHRGNP